jgi:hypothetical protein
MALWSNTDANTSAPIMALHQLNVTANQANMNIAYGNNTTGAFFTGSNVGIFGVDTTEQGVAGNAKGGHAGWVIRTAGTGGRAGRVHIETLVAMGSMTGDGGAIANDDVIFADS